MPCMTHTPSAGVCAMRFYFPTGILRSDGPAHHSKGKRNSCVSPSQILGYTSLVASGLFQQSKGIVSRTRSLNGPSLKMLTSSSRGFMFRGFDKGKAKMRKGLIFLAWSRERLKKGGSQLRGGRSRRFETLLLVLASDSIDIGDGRLVYDRGTAIDDISREVIITTNPFALHRI
ncbi:hypothetical protein VNO77_23030 [Canavalia gladiata]|uniref:Uncharacterized protein n=1 Tax=Canavalia gladiata TaxID=3824 RepID=A0AAN9QB53_CANGL